MRSVTLVTVLLLCSFSWISVSASEFYTVEVQSGEQVTLMCSNFSSSPTQIIWFRAVKKLKPQCVCFLFNVSEPASYCDGFNNLTFEATSNISTVFLKIKRVNLSDSGLYFCGFSVETNPVIVGATYLDVQDVFKGDMKLISWILYAVTGFLAVVVFGLIVLIVKMKRGQRAHTEEPNPQQSESHSSDDFEFPPQPLVNDQEENIKEASQTDPGTDVVFTDTP